VDRLAAVAVAVLFAAAFAGGGLLWVREQRRLHAARDTRALRARRDRLRRAAGWVVVALLVLGAVAIVAGALAR
jgi:hypothetical protein